MAAAPGDRLSSLPDDVLRRVLSFATAKDAAASSALSRRWRPLWRQARALNLDSRPYSATYKQGRHCPPRFGVFFRDAHIAFRQRCRCSAGLLKRLTLHLEQGTYRPEHDGRVAGLLADPATALLEELRVACRNGYDGQYTPPLASLPFAATLRVLELRWCDIEPPTSATALAFPCLVDLRLLDCFLLEGYLQAIVDAAPALTSLTMVNVAHKPAEEEPGSPSRKSYFHMRSRCFRLPLRLRCSTVTAFFFKTYACKEELEPSANSGIELDMPSLRWFRYRACPIKLSLVSPAPGLELVDLDATRREQQVWKYVQVSSMLTGFSTTRALKLRLELIESIIAGGDEDEDDGVILPTFPNLKLLELDGKYKYMNSNTVVAMARLFRSCPAMAELRLRLDMEWNYFHERKTKGLTGGPFAESMDRFERLACISSVRRGAVELGEVSELPATMTNNCAFSCLLTSLRKVTLQFAAKEVNCFQAQLAKFLAENAMVLEEMYVDDGSHFWPDHLCHKVPKWRADSFRARNLTDTTGFRVYQLDNPVVNPVVDSTRQAGYYSD